MSKSDFLELLYSALDMEYGLAVEVSDPKLLRARLYILIREEGLQLGMTVMEDELWIIKKG